MSENEVLNPFAATVAVQSTGALAMQARENTEVMAMVMSAKRFPRDMVRCADRIQNAFTRVTLAEKAAYQFARGGTDITGPSIRAAEAMSQQWGNLANGWREISRMQGPDGVGVSEVEAYSIDFESNSRESIQFVVRHWRDTKSGGYKLKDERDIYELCANQAQRRKRACILAQIPGDVIDMAMQQAAVTMTTAADTSAEGVAKLAQAFAEIGITRELIEKRIQRRLEAMQPAQMVTLRRIYASLRDEMSNPGDWFEIDPAVAPAAATGLDAVRKAAKAKKTKGADAPSPPAETAAPPPPPAEPKRTYAQIAEQILHATDGETAALFLDSARDEVDEQMLAELAAVWKAKWQP